MTDAVAQQTWKFPESLWCMGMIGAVPGARCVAIYLDVDPDGGGVPTDLYDVILAAVRQRYGTGEA